MKYLQLTVHLNLDILLFKQTLKIIKEELQWD